MKFNLDKLERDMNEMFETYTDNACVDIYLSHSNYSIAHVMESIESLYCACWNEYARLCFSI